VQALRHPQVTLRPLFRFQPTGRSSSGMRPGARIANSKGVLGTLGALAIRQHDGAPLLLTSHHVLFGAGAGAGEPVWLACGGGTEQTLRRVATSLYGRLGTVVHDHALHHVDCAVAALDPPFGLPSAWLVETGPPPVVQTGTIVTATGCATGVARGVVVAVVGTDHEPGRLLVQSTSGAPFSAPGDSGAVLRDEGGAAVGLVQGVAPSGETIASPIGPVLHVLGIRLLRPPPGGHR
jgi:hypothetical protein